MAQSDAVDVLNDLIEVSKDGEYGFTQCAEHAKSPDIKSTLMSRASNCASGAAELQRLVTTHGGTPEDSGSATGAMHRGWVSVKSAVSSKDDLAVLEEAERGEDSALKRYRKAAEKDLPADVKAVVQKQLQGAQANHDQIKALRDQLRSVSRTTN